MACDPTILAKLDELLTAVRRYDDPRKAMTEWKQLFRLLQQAGLPTGRVTGVVGMRDMAGLSALIDQLRPAGPAAKGGQTPAASPAADDALDPDTVRKAMAAFKKRLSLTVLDEESKLGHSPLSKGSDATNRSIIPPAEWPEAVWQALARQGRLKYLGHGFYELPRQ